ncbi:hypothetical protein KIN20_021581 [Parelaphostrongylus tenuis]|uniref:Uncharacterized protein n=1 Tax=Parelaphostrongylus tenuis TaxID=148309 RepID=A0AAD5MUB6_PARTN|nr:hypothetical protein KIN20_021581 [Parelaphostrongylus tenuis]
MLTEYADVRTAQRWLMTVCEEEDRLSDKPRDERQRNVDRQAVINCFNTEIAAMFVKVTKSAIR